MAEIGVETEEGALSETITSQVSLTESDDTEEGSANQSSQDELNASQSVEVESGSGNKWNVKEIQEHPTCANLSYDGIRIRWTGSLDTLKEFVESVIKLQGRWSSPGGSTKKFTCSNIDLTITWCAKKQNTLILHGHASFVLIETLIKVCNSLSTSRNITNPYSATNDDIKLTNSPLESMPSELRENADIIDLTKNLAVIAPNETPENVSVTDIETKRYDHDCGCQMRCIRRRT